MNKSCYTCRHYHSWEDYESWEMPHIKWIVYVCDARPTVVNLRQFPFENTKCNLYEDYRGK